MPGMPAAVLRLAKAATQRRLIGEAAKISTYYRWAVRRAKRPGLRKSCVAGGQASSNLPKDINGRDVVIRSARRICCNLGAGRLVR
jgi:hypothetical protein